MKTLLKTKKDMGNLTILYFELVEATGKEFLGKELTPTTNLDHSIHMVARNIFSKKGYYIKSFNNSNQSPCFERISEQEALKILNSTTPFESMEKIFQSHAL